MENNLLNGKCTILVISIFLICYGKRESVEQVERE